MEKELKFEEKKAWVVGLLVDCPFGRALDDCPLNEIRSLPFSERLDWVQQMDETQLDSIIEQHKECLLERETR